MLGSVSQLVVSLMLFYHELGGYSVLGSFAKGYLSLKQGTPVMDSEVLMHDGPDEDATAQCLPALEPQPFRYMTYMFLPNLYCCIWSACLNSANLNDWEVGGCTGSLVWIAAGVCGRDISERRAQNLTSGRAYAG